MATEDGRGATHFRAHARSAVGLAAVIRDNDGTRVWRAKVRDLGLGGAGLEAREAAATGQRIVLEIVVPTRWDPLVVRGEVAWVHPTSGSESWRIGVRFAFEDAAAAWALWDVLGTGAYE